MEVGWFLLLLDNSKHGKSVVGSVSIFCQPTLLHVCLASLTLSAIDIWQVQPWHPPAAIGCLQSRLVLFSSYLYFCSFMYKLKVVASGLYARAIVIFFLPVDYFSTVHLRAPRDWHACSFVCCIKCVPRRMLVILWCVECFSFGDRWFCLFVNLSNIFSHLLIYAMCSAARCCGDDDTVSDTTIFALIILWYYINNIYCTNISYNFSIILSHYRVCSSGCKALKRYL